MGGILKFVKNKLVMLVAIVTAAIIGGATTAVVMAAIPDSSGIIHSCINATGSLRVIDSASDSCTGLETSLNWQQQSPPLAYAHTTYDQTNSQWMLDQERTKNITSATYVSNIYGTGFCYQVSFEPKNVLVTGVSGNFNSLIGLKSSTNGWNNLNAEAACADVTGTNAYIDSGSVAEYYVTFR